MINDDNKKTESKMDEIRRKMRQKKSNRLPELNKTVCKPPGSVSTFSIKLVILDNESRRIVKTNRLTSQIIKVLKLLCNADHRSRHV